MELVAGLLAGGLALWAINFGTFRIFLARHASFKKRLIWAAISLIPLAGFVLFHMFHRAFIGHEAYWFRDEANPLPFLAAGIANYAIYRIFLFRSKGHSNT